MKKNILVTGLIGILFCLSSFAQAGTIMFSKNTYSANAEAAGWTTLYDPLFGEYCDILVIQDNNPGPTPPVSAAVNHHFTGYFGSLLGDDADVTASGNTSLLKVAGSIYGGIVEAGASSHHEREFMANFSELYLSYDYYLYAEKRPAKGGGSAGGQVNTAVQLYDESASSLTWSHTLTKNSAINVPEDELPIIGSIDTIVPLIAGHVYSLSVEVSLDFDVAGNDREVFGTAYLSELSVSVVPLPSTLILLGAGLGCLAMGWKDRCHK